MGLEHFIFKIVIGGVFLLFLIFVISPAVNVIGLITCPKCNPFLNAFFFIIVPVGAIFIGIKRILEVFGRRTT